MKRYLFLCKQKIIYFVHLIFSFFLPFESCIICGDNCKIFPLCKKCITTFFRVELSNDEFCKCCGKKLISENQICVKCRTENSFKCIERVFSLFSYKLWNVEIMFRWKKKGERIFSYFFAYLLAQKLKSIKEYCHDFVIVPVPPRPNKIKEIGWDQVDDIFNLLKYKYKFNATKMLNRVSSQEQKKLDRNQRFEKIKNSYVIKNKISFIPEKVCLIDDVKTTGATLECCAEILKKVGVKTVFALTIYNVS